MMELQVYGGDVLPIYVSRILIGASILGRKCDSSLILLHNHSTRNIYLSKPSGFYNEISDAQ